MLRRLRSSAALALTSGLVLVMSAIGAIPAAASQGDMWTQPGGTPEETSGHSQEVHLPCGSVDIWGDKLENTTGTWVLYHLPPPNTSEEEVARGTYSYSSDGPMKIATIPMSAVHSATGPHFKLELENDNSKWKTFWLDCRLSIKTTQNPATATVGATLNDTATLSNGFSPTGHIVFTLFNPSGEVVHTESVSVHGNGTYSTATGHVADVAGTWHWQAAYSGDDGNDAVSSGRNDEPVVVRKAHLSITTTPNPSSAIVGATLNDTATLSGGDHPTGTITFTLFDPSDSPVHTETAGVDGNGSYATVTGHVAGTAGTWHWSAAYSGDADNRAVQSLKADEPVIVTEEHQQAQPAISTTPNPSSAIVGATLNDTATLSGGDHPTGTITFTLFDPSDAPAYTESVGVDGNGSYATVIGHVADSAGTWHWSAAYGGDHSNKAVHSLKADEPVVVSADHHRAQPSITTTPKPTTANSGTTLKDTATLSGGDSPTGTITFTLYNPSNVAKYTESVAVDGNGVYTTAHGYPAVVEGIWHWKAEYSGDENNLPVASDPANEPVNVNATGEVLAATGATPLSGALGLTLLVFGGLAIMTAAALRRRPA